MATETSAIAGAQETATLTLPQLHALWDPAPLAVWVHQNRRLVYVNPALLGTLGELSLEAVLGQSPLDFVAEGSREEVRQRVQHVEAKNTSASLKEIALRRKDGSACEVRSLAWPISFEGRPAVQASFYDEAALLASKAALSRVESIHAQALEAIPQLVWTTLPDGSHDYFNQRWYDYTGTHPGQTDGAGWADLLHPDDVERTWQVWQHSLQTGEHYQIEYRFRGADGVYRWFMGEADPLRDDQGAILRWFGTCTVIDEQRRYEERLRQSEERFRTAVRTVSDLVWTNNAEGEMRGEQPGWSEFTGQSQSEYQGHGWAAALHPDDVSGTLAAWQEATGERRKFLYEHRVLRRDGVYRRFIVRALPVFCEDGSVREWVGVHTDVTERREQEEHLQQFSRELEERVQQRTLELEVSNRELEAFSYSVSHDLRAPLRTIDGFSLALQEDLGPALDAECSDYLRRIRGGVQRMGGLIDALLQLSRVTRAELVRQDVDLSLVAEEVCEPLLAAAGRSRVELRIEPGLSAHADLRLVQIALENLFGNAFKFTSKLPTAVIELGALPPASEDGRRDFFVRDNGAGFDMQYAGKLFHAFQRLHGDKDFQGSGIGLATVERVIRRHGGVLRAEGTPGAGATFFFSFG